MISWIEEHGWKILNENTKGDENGEYIYTGLRGETVIDYCITDETGGEGIEEMVVGDRMDSDSDFNHLLVVKVKGKEMRKNERVKRIEEVKRGAGAKEGIERFRKNRKNR